MQNAKDSFYIALRNRLAVLNPNRTMMLRGVQRPAILVEEAEAYQDRVPDDTYVLRWTTVRCVSDLPSPLIQMGCELWYASAGSQPNAGLDRGRALTEMDREVFDLLAPFSTQKMSYASTPATAMETQVFWSEPAFLPLQTVRDQLLRTVTVDVFSLEEPSEV